MVLDTHFRSYMLISPVTCNDQMIADQLFTFWIVNIDHLLTEVSYKNWSFVKIAHIQTISCWMSDVYIGQLLSQVISCLRSDVNIKVLLKGQFLISSHINKNQLFIRKNVKIGQLLIILFVTDVRSVLYWEVVTSDLC